LNVPFITKFPPTVKTFRDVEIVPVEFVVVTFPPTVRAALFEVAVSVDAKDPPTERALVMVNVEVTVSVAALDVPLIVKDFTVMVEESVG
jgi:hypothetical protein